MSWLFGLFSHFVFVSTGWWAMTSWANSTWKEGGACLSLPSYALSVSLQVKSIFSVLSLSLSLTFSHTGWIPILPLALAFGPTPSFCMFRRWLGGSGRALWPLKRRFFRGTLQTEGYDKFPRMHLAAIGSGSRKTKSCFFSHCSAVIMSL